MNVPILYPRDWTQYRLADSGDGEKLEMFGDYFLVRPDPRAIWSKGNPSLWTQADARFRRTDPKMGDWEVRRPPPDSWRISYGNLTFTLRPTEFKHVGIFPEQAVNWDWLGKNLREKPLKILNLFAYTGGATMACLASGAQVTHVDAAKSTIAWAKENLAASGLSEKPVRWIEDDAMKFVQREAKRGNAYDGIIMDPPRFGRGAKGEVWKLETDLPKLLHAVKGILSERPAFLLVNAYTADISSIALYNGVRDIVSGYGGTTSFGELALKEDETDRLLPNGIFSRWSADEAESVHE